METKSNKHMHYVITGAAGNIAKPLALTLLRAGHQVTALGRSQQNLSELITAGAQVAIGSVEDPEFLRKAFATADAVHTMVPPKWDAPDWKAYIASIGKNFADAIRSSSVQFVVNLSSIGAHMPKGCGPVSGLHQVEAYLNALDTVHIRHLRPAFFYNNLLSDIPMIKSMDIIGGNFGDAKTRMVLVDTNDIAAVAAEELLACAFRGHSIRYIASDEKTAGEIAAVLGASISKPQLPWVEFSDEQTLQGMRQAGLSVEVASNYEEMGRAIRTGEMYRDYWAHHPENLGPTKLQDFARAFAAVYNSAN